MRSPLNKAHRVTSSYGLRNLKGTPEMHNGLDLVPLDGVHPCDLYAVCDGVVEDVRKTVPDSHTGLKVRDMVTGNYVNIRTKSGCLVIYRHLKANSIPENIVKGSQVSVNQKIGVMGTTGQSTGVHLHYELRDSKGASLDPAPYIGTEKMLGDSVVASSAKPIQSTQSFKIDDRVKVLNAVTYDGGTFKTYYSVYDVLQINGDRIVIGIKGVGVTAAIKAANLQKVID
jgi:hypothetical protein